MVVEGVGSILSKREMVVCSLQDPGLTSGRCAWLLDKVEAKSPVGGLGRRRAPLQGVGVHPDVERFRIA